MYIPACPLTEANAEYLKRQRDTFFEGICSNLQGITSCADALSRNTGPRFSFRRRGKRTSRPPDSRFRDAEHRYRGSTGYGSRQVRQRSKGPARKGTSNATGCEFNIGVRLSQSFEIKQELPSVREWWRGFMVRIETLLMGIVFHHWGRFAAALPGSTDWICV